MATILVIALCVAAGRWQESRMHAKELLRAQFDAAATAPALRIADLPATGADWAPLRYRPVALEGEFDASHQILLDNKVHAARAGYDAIAPFRLADGRLLLVDRGWLPQGLSRADVPVAVPPKGNVTLRGRINLPPKGYVELKSESSPGTVWQHLDLTRFAAASGLQFEPVLVEQIAPAAPGDDLIRERRAPDFGIDTHRIYRVQWFIFAGLAAIYWLVTHWPRRVRAATGRLDG
ncbi:MAG: SURF1 family protein [Betaproteobacteria bacterium]